MPIRDRLSNIKLEDVSELLPAGQLLGQIVL